MSYLVFGVNEPIDSLLRDLLERVTQLIEQRSIHLASELRVGLVQKLNNLLRHQQWSALAVGGACCQEEDLAEELVNVVVGRQSRQRLDGKLGEDTLEVLDERLDKRVRRAAGMPG